MNILQVSTYDFAGGAEAVATNLHRQYRRRGHAAWLAVGHQRGTEPGVYQIKNAVGPRGWARFWWGVEEWAPKSPLPGRVTLARTARLLADPPRWQAQRRGHEALSYRSTWHLPDSGPVRPDILHAHNLHGDYFDLNALPHLSRQLPVFLTLHDAWLLSGHCAHSFACERWRTGCGKCPDLTIPPAIPRDNTAENWRTKRDLYARSRLYLSTPCEWLLNRVKQSILAAAVVEAKVIPYGLDLATFRPADQRSARARLGLPLEAVILLIAANGLFLNRWKDFATLRAAIALLAESTCLPPIHFVALGEAGPAEQVGGVQIEFVTFEKDPALVAAYYQAADVYVHAARADTFPNTVLEALACGTPVVATAVGGIPEQIIDGQDGFLAAAGDAASLAAAIRRLVEAADLRLAFGRSGAEKAKRLYDLTRQTDEYLGWYEGAVERQARSAVNAHG